MLKIIARIQTAIGSSPSQKSAVDTIIQWRRKPSGQLVFDSGRREITQFFQAIDILLQQTPAENGVNDELISIAVARMRHEFAAVLSRIVDYQANPVSTTEWSSVTDSTGYVFRYEDYVISEPPSDDIISYLKNIAQRMSFNGRLKACILDYKSLRKKSLLSHLKRLRFEELAIGVDKMRRIVWDDLKVKMEIWVEISRICVRILFEREMRLCEEIFEGLGDAKDECFMGTVGGIAHHLFGFAEAMSLRKLPYERMEAVLGLYAAYISVKPNVNALFASDRGKEMRRICEETLSRIENEVERMLHDFENDVANESSSVSNDSGEVHQLTKYVMEQIHVMVRNRNLLTSFIKKGPSLNLGDLLMDSKDGSFLDLHLISIVVVLQLNLKSKSESFENPSLGKLFMMNNVHYITQNIEGSNELKEMIGFSYVDKLSENLNLSVTGYLSSVCSKLLRCFNEKGLYRIGWFKSRPSKTAVRKRIKAFIAALEDIESDHSLWTIPDSQLRSRVCFLMLGKLVSAYRNFIQNPEIENEVRLVLDENVDLEELISSKLSQLFQENQLLQRYS